MAGKFSAHEVDSDMICGGDLKSGMEAETVLSDVVRNYQTTQWLSTGPLSPLHFVMISFPHKISVVWRVHFAVSLFPKMKFFKVSQLRKCAFKNGL